ncbi:DNA-binding transcriptional LysR family regulator [Streptosporangium album]|uniref:DNA-binding transcriptional LysR family regulator n=1 Tax=Streptosporangium album TaxID=47479 RepID=A0A7W7RRI6_9ACTN|nr:LysR family transcriptional regulator [Streptosporangium album]MBB4936857.1 DNA-binding transcriptional LysR family regulator [Streptosporangium album]
MHPRPPAVRLSASNPITELLSCPPELLDTTLDQLRTLVVVRETGSALRAARTLGREQSSIQKQLDTLNHNFQALCGEMLVTKQGRGRDFLFTATGETVVESARRTLGQWLEEINACRRHIGSTLTAGTTEFTLWLLSRAWERLSDEFVRREIDFRIVHIRTRDFWTQLETGQVDLLCGSLVTQVGDKTHHKRYDVIEWRRGTPVLLTNLPVTELPSASVGASELDRLPLIVPGSGLIADFLARWYGPGFRNRLRIVADIDDVQYGIALMRSRMASGCMIVTRTLGRRAVERAAAEGSELRVVELTHDLEPKLETVSAIFARKGERERYGSDHPLNLLWEALRHEVAETGHLPASA